MESDNYVLPRDEMVKNLSETERQSSKQGPNLTENYCLAFCKKIEKIFCSKFCEIRTIFFCKTSICFYCHTMIQVHRYRKAKIDCLSLFMCPLLAQLKIGFFSSFSAAAVYSTNETNKAGLKQSIIFRCLCLGQRRET